MDYASLVKRVAGANRELGRFDGLLYRIPNPEVLLSPIATQEAVLSSRIEGTGATLSDVLQFESGELFPLGDERGRDVVKRALHSDLVSITLADAELSLARYVLEGSNCFSTRLAPYET